MKICIYCASSDKISSGYFDATEKLALALIQQNIEVVYGGGSSGLMGKLADVMLANGGKIKGIMPRFMNEVEWAHKKLEDIEFTETMHERKAKFLENIDGLVALPGGTGTLEELLEAMTLKKLGIYTKPIVILNTLNYYEPLKLMLQQCVTENFMLERHTDMWTFVDEPDQVIPALLSSKTWDNNAIHFARVS
ncbi:MAG: TIGR00730 family Rossman fold protein [Sphingobacteriales bacterium]|jgi:uncharacterized protein (TIGR00730 family)